MLYKSHEHCPPEPPQSHAYQSQSLHTLAAPEPITAELTSTTLKKQADLYLRLRKLDRYFAAVRSVLCI